MGGWTNGQMGNKVQNRFGLAALAVFRFCFQALKPFCMCANPISGPSKVHKSYRVAVPWRRDTSRCCYDSRGAVVDTYAYRSTHGAMAHHGIFHPNRSKIDVGWRKSDSAAFKRGGGRNTYSLAGALDYPITSRIRLRRLVRSLCGSPAVQENLWYCCRSSCTYLSNMEVARLNEHILDHSDQT